MYMSYILDFKQVKGILIILIILSMLYTDISDDLCFMNHSNSAGHFLQCNKICDQIH